MLGLFALMAGQYDQTIEIFKQRDSLFGDGVRLHFDTMVSNVIADNPGLLQQVAALDAGLTSDPFDAVTRFAAG